MYIDEVKYGCITNGYSILPLKSVIFDEALIISDEVYGIPNDDVNCTLPALTFFSIIEEVAI